MMRSTIMRPALGVVAGQVGDADALGAGGGEVEQPRRHELVVEHQVGAAAGTPTARSVSSSGVARPGPTR